MEVLASFQKLQRHIPIRVEHMHAKIQGILHDKAGTLHLGTQQRHVAVQGLGLAKRRCDAHDGVSVDSD